MDTSLEWYYARSGMVYGALFYKKVDGFIANVVQEEFYGGAAWEVTRPLNGNNGKIRGFELGFEGFADFLPAPFDGFGVQANYTYVDSEAPSPAASDTSGRALLVPLEGLSKNSYNLIGIYEKGPLAIRAAYNWRSDWVRTTAGNGTGNLPIFDDGFGQLDASISYDIMEGVTVILDGVNLTDTERSTIFGRETRPRDYVLTDRRLGLGVRVDL
jgi:TonB-dependent receptor